MRATPPSDASARSRAQLAAARVVRANRTAPPDVINIRVEELTGDRPFGNLDDFIGQEELRALSDQYKRIAGYSVEALATTAAPSVA